MSTDILKAIQDGEIFCHSNKTHVNEIPWHEHPTFAGVALKHLITSTNTDGKFSSHLVRVQSGYEIGEHIHAGKWELHEVIAGHGKCIMNNEEVEYYEGVAAVVPSDIPHIVKALEEDLYILAKFVPALI